VTGLTVVLQDRQHVFVKIRRQLLGGCHPNRHDEQRGNQQGAGHSDIVASSAILVLLPYLQLIARMMTAIGNSGLFQSCSFSNNLGEIVAVGGVQL
jgi:hypothetical protein